MTSGTAILKEVFNACQVFTQGLGQFVDIAMTLLTEPFFETVSIWVNKIVVNTGFDFLDDFLETVLNVLVELTNQLLGVGDYTLLELVCGAGLWFIVAYTVAKWVADIVF